MVLLVLIGLIVLLGTVLYYYWKKKISYWEKRQIPFVKPSFPFGNIKDIVFMKKTIGEVYDEIYKSLNDKPYGGFYRFVNPSLMLKDPVLIKSVFVSKFNNFNGNDYYVDPQVEPILGLNPFNLVGPDWIKTRAIVTSSFTPSKIKGMMTDMYKICDNLKTYLKTKEDEFLESYDVFGKYTTDIIASCAYGLDSNSLLNPNSELRKISCRMFNTGIKGTIALLCALYSKKLGNILKFKIFSDEVNDYFVNFIKNASEHRIKNNIKRNDFLQNLINSNLERTEKGEEELYNHQEMAAHCMTFFLDGFETTSILLGFIIYELSLNDEVQTKLREEIREFGRNIKNFDFEKIHELNYLDMVIKETLRKHPPGTTMARLCNESVILNNPETEDSIYILKGSSVTLPMYSIQNDPKFFPQPFKFDPLRFTKENISTRPEYSYFPFGGGPRSCPGNKFAMTMIKLCVVATVMDFKLEPKIRDETQLELNPMNTFFHSVKNGLWVKYTYLEDEA